MSWINDFFSGENYSIDNPELNPNHLRDYLLTMIEPITNEELKYPIVVPRRYVDNRNRKRICFYLIGEGSRQLSELRNVANAYLGEVASRVVPGIHSHSEDSEEKILLNQFPQGYIKILTSKNMGDDNQVIGNIVGNLFRILNECIAQFHQRPPLYSTIKRPLARTLRDFFTACDNDDGNSAKYYSNELKDGRRLSPKNLLSIRFQVMAAANEWQTILEHPKLPDLLQGRIPSVIQLLVLTALTRSKFKSTELKDLKVEDVKDSLSDYKNIFLLSPNFPKTERYTEIWKCWAIGASVLGHKEITQYLPETIISPKWREEFLQWSDQKPVSLKVDAPSLSTLISNTPSAEVAVKLLKETINLTHSENEKIFKCLEAYPQKIKEKVMEKNICQIMWGELTKQFADTVTFHSWSDFLSRLIKDDENDSYHEIRDYYQDWSVDDWDEAETEELLEQLTDSKGAKMFRNIIPLLLQWISNHDVKTNGSFYKTILIILSTDETRSSEDLVLATDLLIRLIESGHTPEDYKEGIQSMAECWDEIKSANNMDNVIETIENLYHYSCADNTERTKFWEEIKQFSFKEWRKFSREQQMLITELCNEIDGSCDFPEVVTEQEFENIDDVSNFEGKKLGIYTLMEGAGQRAKNVLESLYPGMKVTLNNDTTASKALVNLTKSADFFIFSSKNAVHKAFIPVSRLRDDIIYPGGKGSSSIVRAFMQSANA